MWDCLYIYEIHDIAVGVVNANSEQDATNKVKNAYITHWIGFGDDDIIVYKADGRWFDDDPDVLEVCEIN